jgi:hypothetical protein
MKPSPNAILLSTSYRNAKIGEHERKSPAMPGFSVTLESVAALTGRRE